ncbi:hypothetical protein AXG93_3348s1160 [Marchantia polymorpha subsp. ruderalis]|uniref:Uncharacterized protein n=1 Tax=Marchantia polymorpha subsp. ruderalis TaxID=1480154 RepID=A0A176VNF7_MARPO|nr:hypothetical protein AXG93_3348s1160 [Marchantia polymorpha subsp. ruderalis]
MLSSPVLQLQQEGGIAYKEFSRSASGDGRNCHCPWKAVERSSFYSNSEEVCLGKGGAQTCPPARLTDVVIAKEQHHPSMPASSNDEDRTACRLVMDPYAIAALGGHYTAVPLNQSPTGPRPTSQTQRPGRRPLGRKDLLEIALFGLSTVASFRLGGLTLIRLRHLSL